MGPVKNLSGAVLSRIVMVEVALLGAMWYPFSWSPGLVGKFLMMYVLAATLLAAIALRVRAGQLKTLKTNLDLLLLAGIVGGAALSAFVSNDTISILGTAAHRAGLITYVIYGLVYIYFSSLREGSRIELFGVGLSAAVLMNLVGGVLAQSLLPANQFSARFVGTFAEPSFLAGFLLIAVPACGWLAVYGSTRTARIIGTLAVLTGLAQLFLSGSRAGYFGLLAASVALLLIYLAESSGRLRYAVAAAVVLLLFLPILTPRFSLTSLSAGTSERLQTMRPISETGGNYLVGAGPDRFRLATQNRYLHFGAHNGFINEVGSIGWPAALAFVGLIIINAARLTRRIRAPKDGKSRSIESWLLIAIIGYTVFSFGNYTRTYVNVLFFATLGLAAGSTVGLRVAALELRGRIATLVAAAVLISLVSAAAGRTVVGNYYYWSHRGVDISAPILSAWDPLTYAVAWDPQNEIFREARGQMARKLIAMRVPDIPGRMEIRATAVEDWEFLFSRVYGSGAVYNLLLRRYDEAGVQPSRRVAPPGPR